MMSLWDALRMNMMISYQELVRTFLKCKTYRRKYFLGDGMTDIAKMNIEKWTKECEKKWRKKK
ncbi:hypothetical protein D0Y97_19250 [Escherichia coli]|nr:hypothetical protein [Escherichia coli]